MPSETIERFIRSFQTNRTKFEAFCRSLTEEELARPVPDSDWYVKDFIAHLGTLDTMLTQQVEALAAGRNGTMGGNAGEFDIDAWNEVEVQKRRDWPVEQLLHEAAANRAKFLEALNELTDDQIEQTMHFTGDNKRDPADLPYKLFLGGLARHDPIHVADMIKALPERAEAVEITEWLNDSIVRWYQTAMAGPPKR